MELPNIGNDGQDIGLESPKEKRGMYKWVLAVSVMLNLYLINKNYEQGEARDKVFYEMIKMQNTTKQKVDTIINKL